MKLKKIIYQSANEEGKTIESDCRIFVHGSVATPMHSFKALFKRKPELKTVELNNISTLGDGVFDQTDSGKIFFSIT